MRELVSLDDAVVLITDHTRIVGEEEIALLSALGRVISKDIFAPGNFPPFDRSPLDGYAVRATDIKEAKPGKPVELEVSQEIPAGNYSEIEVVRNQAAKILTGAPIPPGADVVIRFEDVKKKKGPRIEVFNPMPAYSNYCFAGEDIQEGEMVLAAGSRVDPAVITLFAALGFYFAPVYRIPQITIISTGDELVDINEQLASGKIYNSNSYSIAADVQLTGARPVCSGIVEDNPELIANKIEAALEISDMVITTGGISVGDYDVVKEALTIMGADILFHRVNMRPGSPALGAVKNGKIIISLSGNPAAAFVSYHLIAKPVILKLMGMTKWEFISSTAVLQEDYPKASKPRRFLRGRAFLDVGELKVRLTGKQNPGIIRSMLNCNCLIDIPANSPGLKAGDNVRVILLH